MPNYTTIEKEFLAVVFALKKFRPYLPGTKTTIFTDYYVLRYLMLKKDTKARLIHWIFLFQVSKTSSPIISLVPLPTSSQSLITSLMNNYQPPLENHGLLTQLTTQSQTEPHLIGQDKMYIGSCLKSDISFWRNLISLNIVPTKLFEDVLLMRKQRVFQPFVMNLHAVDTLVPEKQPKMFYRVGYISPLCLKMPLTFSRRAQDAK